MALDGILTSAIVSELSNKILYGKIEKVYQPEADELIFHVHSKQGNFKLYVSCSSSHARTHLVEESFANPQIPMSFCMLLRKHLQGGRILEISQKDSERIIEFSIETLSELGFSVNKKLIIEIMGKHSNIIVVDADSGKIIDSIKRISIDVNRVRQLLPGKLYEYPPTQNKVPFISATLKDVKAICTCSLDALPKALLEGIQGVSPAISNVLVSTAEDTHPNDVANVIYEKIRSMQDDLKSYRFSPVVYLNEENIPLDFHVFPLEAEGYCEKVVFSGVSEMVEYYFLRKESSNRVKQKSNDLDRAVRNSLDKLYLKKQRLSEDLLKAENSENYRLYGELLTANIHTIKNGDRTAHITNYYDGSEIEIPLDIRHTPQKNAQMYFKKYSKSKTAVKEKKLQLEETNIDISYLESVASFVENASTIEETEELRNELVDGGYLRKRKNNYASKKSKPVPYEYKTSDGFRILVGKNNRDNDLLTFKIASNKDVWFHTKDIPGSHVVLLTEGTSLSEVAIFEAAAIAAYHSKGRNSENVPVDYVPMRHVKKPNGAKPGMVIFTNNKTVYVTPKLPD